MNKYIIELFESSKDAYEVQKAFSEDFNRPLLAVLAKGREAEILEAAKKANLEYDQRRTRC